MLLLIVKPGVHIGDVWPFRYYTITHQYTHSTSSCIPAKKNRTTVLTHLCGDNIAGAEKLNTAKISDRLGNFKFNAY